MKTIVFFTADWCKVCKQVLPMFAGIPHEVVNLSDPTKEGRGVAAGVQSLPTIIVFDEGGAEAYRHSGIIGRSEFNYLLRVAGLEPKQAFAG